MTNANSPLDYDPHAKSNMLISNEIRQKYHKLGVAVGRFSLISAITVSVVLLLLGVRVYSNLSQTFYVIIPGEYSPLYLYVIILLWVVAIGLLGVVGRYAGLLQEFANQGSEKDLKEILEQKMLIFVVGSLIQFAMVLTVAFLIFAA